MLLDHFVRQLAVSWPVWTREPAECPTFALWTAEPSKDVVIWKQERALNSVSQSSIFRTFQGWMALRSDIVLKPTYVVYVVKLLQLRKHWECFLISSCRTHTSSCVPSFVLLSPPTQVIILMPRTGSLVRFCSFGFWFALLNVLIIDMSSPEFHGIHPKDGGYIGPQLCILIFNCPRQGRRCRRFTPATPWHCDAIHSGTY